MPDLDIGPFTILSSCLPISHFTWVWLRHSVAWLVYFSPKPPHPLSKQVKLFNIFRKELSLHFQHLSIPVMLFLINKVQKEYTAVIRAVRITRSQYIREAVKKLVFLGIIVAWSSLAVNSCQHGHNYFTLCHPKQSGSDDRCMHLYLQLLVHQHHLHWSSSSAIIIKRGNNSSTTAAPPGPTTCHARLKVANQKPP